ncbi:MAG: phage tail tape measure protein [Rhizomicrobium sp.]
MANSASQFQIVITALDKASATLRAVNMRVAAMKAPFVGVSEAAANLAKEARLPELAEAARNAGEQFVGLADNIRGVLTPLAALAGIAGIGGLIEAAKGAAEYGEQIYLASQKTGIAVDQIGAFHFAAKEAGISAEAMDKGLEHLNRAVAQAAEGQKQYVSLFRAMHISIRNANGSLKDAAQLFPELADKFKNSKSIVEKTNAAWTLFERSGGDLIPMLVKGGAATQAMVEEFNHLHGPMTKAAALASKELAESFDRFQLATEGVRDAVGEALAPTIEKLIGPLTEWMAANRGIIASNVAKWASNVADVLKKIDWAKVGHDIMGIARTIGGFIAMLGPTGTAIAGLGIMFSGTIRAVLGLGRAFIMLAFASPILTAIVVAVAAVAFAAYEIYEHWPQIKAFFVGLWESVRTTFDGAIKWIGAQLSAWGTDTLNLVSGAWNAVVSFFGAVWNDIVAAFKWGYENVLPWLPGGPIVKLIIDNWGQIAGFFVGVWTAAERVFLAATTWIGAHLSAWAQGTVKAIVGAWAVVKTFFATLWDGIVKIFDAAWKKIAPIVRPIIEAAEYIGRQFASSKNGAARVEARHWSTITHAMSSAPAWDGRADAPYPKSAFGAGSLYGGEASNATREEAITHVKVDFNNGPPGMRVTVDSSGPVTHELNVGPAWSPAF